MEACRYGTADAESIGDVEDTGELAVGRVAELTVILVANRGRQGETVGDVGFEVDIDGVTVLVGRLGSREAAKTVRARREALVSQHTECERGRIAGVQIEFLFAVLVTKRDVQVRCHTDVDSVYEVCVENGLSLLLAAWREISRCGRAKRGIHGVTDEEVGSVRARLRADVIIQSGAEIEHTAQTQCQRHVLVIAAEARYEAGRDGLDEREAVFGCDYLAQDSRIRDNTIERDAVGAAGATTCEITDQNGRNAVRIFEAGKRIHRWAAVDTGPLLTRGRPHDVTVEEATGGGPLPVVTEEVDLCSLTELVGRIDEELDVVLDVRLTPVLRGFAGVRIDCLEIGNRGVASVDARLHIVTDDRANRTFDIAVLGSHVDEARVAERQAGIGGDQVVVTVALVRRAVVGLHFEAVGVIAQHEVDDTRDRV